MAGVATALAGLLVAVILAAVTVSRLLPVIDGRDEAHSDLPQEPPSLEANRSLVHQPTTLLEPNGTATGHNVTGLARLQSHERAEPSAQPGRFHRLPLYLLHTLLYVLYTALCPLIVLLWWMNVTQAQVWEWLRLQGLAAKAKLTMLKRATASFMSLPYLLQELDNYPLLHKAIEIGSFGKKMTNEALVVALRQRAGTDSLKAAMERAEKRISALEIHLGDSRKELEERERAEARVGREVHETKDEAQALTRELEQEREERRRGVGELTEVLAQGSAAMKRMQREAGERDRAVHALKLGVDRVVQVVQSCAGKSELVGVNEGLAALKGEMDRAVHELKLSVDRVVQIAPCKLELVVVKAALAALKERVHGYKTAAEREMREVREHKGRELTEVKRELAAVRREVCENKAASQRKLNEMRNIIGAVEQRNGCTAARMVEREEELAAVKGQLAGVTRELPQLKEAARREASEFSEGKLATARQDLPQQITAEVDEMRMKFQEKTAKFAAVLKQRERELAAVKQQLAEFRKAAEQEANELRDTVGALQEGSEGAGAMVREEGGREFGKQGCEAVWNGAAKGGQREGVGEAIWQRLESPSGKSRLDLSGLSGLSDAVLACVSTMTHLTALNLAGSLGFTAKGISCLNKLLWLQKLHLSGTPVADEHLKGVEALSRLECLSLANTEVTDSGLVNLVGLPSLKRLDLAGCSCVTSAGMAHVGKITTLKQADLRRTGVADDGLQQLTSLVKLEELLLPSGRCVNHKTLCLRLGWRGNSKKRE